MKLRLLLILVAGILLAATGVSAQDTTPIKITMWDIPESDSYVKWWKDYAAAFNAAHPGVEVDIEYFESEPYKARVQAALVAGTEPDIFYSIPGMQTATYVSEGKFLALDTLLDKTKFAASATGTCTIDGKWVCMPLYLAPSFIYYNMKMFADAGVNPEKDWANPAQPTWDEFLAAADKLKAAGQVPIALGNGDNWPGLFFYWAAQNRYGGTQEFSDALSGKGSYCAPSFLKAGALVQQLDKKGYLPIGYNGIAGDQKYSLFTQSTGAMIFQGPWMVGTIEGEAPEGFKFGVFQFPSIADGLADSQTDVMTGIDALFVSAKTAHPDIVGEFLSGFADPDRAIDFMKTTANVSVINSVQSVTASSGIDPALLNLMTSSANAKHTYPWWDSALPPVVSDAMLNMSQKLFTGEITPEDFCKGLDAAAAAK